MYSTERGNRESLIRNRIRDQVLESTPTCAHVHPAVADPVHFTSVQNMESVSSFAGADFESVLRILQRFPAV